MPIDAETLLRELCALDVRRARVSQRGRFEVVRDVDFAAVGVHHSLRVPDALQQLGLRRDAAHHLGAAGHELARADRLVRALGAAVRLPVRDLEQRLAVGVRRQAVRLGKRRAVEVAAQRRVVDVGHLRNKLAVNLLDFASQFGIIAQIETLNYFII